MLGRTRFPGSFKSNRSTGEVIPQVREASDRLCRVVWVMRYPASSSIVNFPCDVKIPRNRNLRAGAPEPAKRLSSTIRGVRTMLVAHGRACRARVFAVGVMAFQAVN